MRTGFCKACKACVPKTEVWNQSSAQGEIYSHMRERWVLKDGKFPREVRKEGRKKYEQKQGGVKEQDVFQGGQIFEHDYSPKQVVRDEAGETGSPETIQDLSWFCTKAHGMPTWFLFIFRNREMSLNSYQQVSLSRGKK